MVHQSFDIVLPYGLSLTSVLIATLVWISAKGYVKERLCKNRWFDRQLAGLAGALIVILSILIHETGYKILASLLKIEVENFWNIRSQTDLLFTQSSPETVIALSALGPLVYLLIGLSAYVAAILLQECLLKTIMQYVCWTNVRLFLWNMAPFFLTDGSNLLGGVIWLITGSPEQARDSLSWTPILAFGMWGFWKWGWKFIGFHWEDILEERV